MKKDAELEDRIRRTIAYHDMLNSESHVAVGLSGVDSYALFRYLSRNHDPDLLTGVTVLETESCQRVDEIRMWREITASSSIPYVVVSFRDEFGASLDDIVDELGSSLPLAPCLICAKLRNEALRKIATRIGANVVATGGNADDVLSVMLIRLLGGPLVSQGGVVYEHRAAPVYSDMPITYCSPLFYVRKGVIRDYVDDMSNLFPAYHCKFMQARGELKLEAALGALLELFPDAHELATYAAANLPINPDIRTCPRCGQKRRLLPADVCPSCRILASLETQGNA